MEHKDTAKAAVLNMQDVADMLKISRSGVQKLIASNAIVRPFKIGRRNYWLPGQIEDMLKTRAETAQQNPGRSESCLKRLSFFNKIMN